MKYVRFSVVVYLLVCSHFVSSQNLIRNPGFELKGFEDRHRFTAHNLFQSKYGIQWARTSDRFMGIGHYGDPNEFFATGNVSLPPIVASECQTDLGDSHAYVVFRSPKSKSVKKRLIYSALLRPVEKHTVLSFSCLLGRSINVFGTEEKQELNHSYGIYLYKVDSLQKDMISQQIVRFSDYYNGLLIDTFTRISDTIIIDNDYDHIGIGSFESDTFGGVLIIDNLNMVVLANAFSDSNRLAKTTESESMQLVEREPEEQLQLILYYSTGNYLLNIEQRDSMRMKMSQLDLSDAHFKIVGFADGLGNSMQNKRLSGLRINEVLRCLDEFLPPTIEYITVSQGEEMSIDDMSDGNMRKVEIYLCR